MARVLKFLHLLGVIAFLGSILGHVVSSTMGGVPGPSVDFITARRHILLASQVLTMPGLYLAVASGLAMVQFTRPVPPWLLLHGAMGIAVLALAVLVVMPTVRAVLADATAAAQGHADVAIITADYQRETGVGSLNLILSLGAMVLATWRPQFGRLHS